MRYPGRVIKVGETDARIVKALKTALNKALVLRGSEAIVLEPDNPAFGPQMKQAVKLFQARHLDEQGQPLKTDGEVGSLTWAALFGPADVPQHVQPHDPLLVTVLAVAGSQADAGVREQPRNSNRGPEVDDYLRRAGMQPGVAWCCAFTYWCFDEASRQTGQANPMFKTAGCLHHWQNAPGQGARRLLARDAVADPGRVQPGAIFIMDFGGGLGHTGLVERIEGGYIHTIEGNTDASQGREGGGVYRLQRKLASINKGFIDYAGV
jgi:hypothetical protein